MKKFKNIKVRNGKHECQFKLTLAEYGLRSLRNTTIHLHSILKDIILSLKVLCVWEIRCKLFYDWLYKTHFMKIHKKYIPFFSRSAVWSTVSKDFCRSTRIKPVKVFICFSYSKIHKLYKTRTCWKICTKTWLILDTYSCSCR